jgi:hypothetical protein
MIANAVVDIWRCEGVEPVNKYEDDLAILQTPVPYGPFEKDGFYYTHNRASIVAAIASLEVPLHPEKGTPEFTLTFVYLGLLWDIPCR